MLAGEERRTLLHVLAGRSVGDAAELPVERTVQEKGFPQGDRNGEDELPVGDEGEDELDHALGPLDCPALSARRAETSCAA